MRRWFIYLVRDGFFVKIGLAKDLRARISALQVGNPRQLTLWAVAEVSSKVEGIETERAMHAYWAKQKIRGEWFVLTEGLEGFVAEAFKVMNLQVKPKKAGGGPRNKIWQRDALDDL